MAAFGGRQPAEGLPDRRTVVVVVHALQADAGGALTMGQPRERLGYLLVFRRAVRKAHSHAAKPESRDFQVALSEFTRFHY